MSCQKLGSGMFGGACVHMCVCVCVRVCMCDHANINTCVTVTEVSLEKILGITCLMLFAL